MNTLANELESLRSNGTHLDVSVIASVISRRYQIKSTIDTNHRTSGLAAEEFRNRKELQEMRRQGGNTEHLEARREEIKKLQKIEKLKRERQANGRRFDRDKWQAYAKAMNPETTVECKVAKEEIEEQLGRKFARSEPIRHEDVPDYMERVSTTMLDITIRPKDLREALKGKKAKASPGRDEVMYWMLRDATEDNTVAEILCLALNRVLDGIDPIPLAWREARIKLLFKGKGCPTAFDNYRPLAITSILGKLLNTMIKTKMLDHCRVHSVIDEKVQKGFMPKVSGCLDHIAAMMNIMRVAKASKGDFYALLLDLKAAYDSVPHHKLWKLLRHVGISEQIVRYLERLYGGALLYVETKDFTTSSLPYQRGVMQGDTLSPLLFTIYFMVIIRAGARGNKDRGFFVKNNYQHHLKAFADDLNVVDTSLDKLKESWRLLKEGMEWCELEVNAAKSRILTFKKGAYVEQPPIDIGEGLLIKCGVKEGAAFLGLDISRCMTQAKVAELLQERMAKELAHISSLNYPLHAQLFFYEIGVLSKFRWWFAIYENVSEATVLLLQRMAYQAFRKWGSFSDKFTGETLTSQRAFGIEDLRQTFRATRAIALLNGVKAADPITAEAYRSKAELPPPASKDVDLHRIIAGIDQKADGDPHDYTTKRGLKKEAAAKLDTKEPRKLKGLGWIWTLPKFDQSEASLLKGTLRLLNEKQLRFGLRALCNQLNNYEVVGRKLRWANEQTLCPLCRNQSQSLYHIMNGCTYMLDKGRYTVRHDAVLRAIADRIKLAYRGNEDINVWMDKDGKYTSDKARLLPQGLQDKAELRRPDIIIEEEWKRLIFIELTCPYDTLKNLEAAHKRKTDKYQSLVDKIKREHSYQYETVELHCVEVGSRGYIANTLKEIIPHITCGRGHPSTKDFLKGLGKISLIESMRIYDSRNTK
jgi:hypothetical protein